MLHKKDGTGIRIKHWRIIAFYLILYDVVAVNASYFLGLLLRFDFSYSAIPYEYLHAFILFTPFYTVFCIAVFSLLHLYNSLWRFASVSELNRILLASVITTAFQALAISLFLKRMPLSYYVVGAIVQFVLILAARFSYRFITLERNKRKKYAPVTHKAMIIGAGSAGQMIIRELKSSASSETVPVCVIDDNPNKWKRTIAGVPIVGGRDYILEAAKKYGIDKILFAIPSASAAEKRDILTICKETGCELKALPGMLQLARGDVSVNDMRPVAVEDLLGREPVKVDLDEILGYIKDRVVIVTGGGGSIGSELCRQIAGHEPKQLIIFDIYENNAYDIQQELKRKYGASLDLVVLIGSVRDSLRLEDVFSKYRPDIVFHAAAHKHVPLMEDSPAEAIKNNVVGTYKTAYAALLHGVKRFVLISTDKAVNPVNIMGASKRLCEMIIQCMDLISMKKRTDLLPLISQHSGDKGPEGAISGPIEVLSVPDNDAAKIPDFGEGAAQENAPAGESCGTRFVAVRFGNVLGSNGSVIPLFKKQIAEGGPVTVTDPEIIRYFMTIPEAVSLVLQAGVYAKGGEIFVLDMGEPVKIDTLARNLIRLCGHVPDEDIKIEYIGLRPGEKLYEEKLMAEEGTLTTANKVIHIGKPIHFDTESFLRRLPVLAEASYKNSPDIVKMVEDMVPTFHPARAGAGEKD